MEEGPSKFILNVSWTYDPTNAKKHVPLWISAGSSVATVFPPRQPCATVREIYLPVPDRWWFRSRIPLRSCSRHEVSKFITANGPTLDRFAGILVASRQSWQFHGAEC